MKRLLGFVLMIAVLLCGSSAMAAGEAEEQFTTRNGDTLYQVALLQSLVQGYDFV